MAKRKEVIKKADFHQRRKALNLTHETFANLVRINKGSVQNWRVIPLWALRVIELLEEREDLIKKITKT